MDEIEIIPPSHPLKAVVRPPGSKSITNRILLLAALAHGESIIDAALFSEDTRHMADSLRRLGFRIEADETAGRISIFGAGGAIPALGADLFIGGSGTAMRFLSAFVTLGHGAFRLDGNAQMRARPIGELVRALNALGARAESENRDEYPPIIVERGPEDFAGGETRIDAHVSSQFASGLLMPAPLWRNGVILHIEGDTAQPFIQMTVKLMQERGIEVALEDDAVVVRGRQAYRPGPFTVEPDASAASYFAAAAALCGGMVEIRGLTANSSQGDLAFFGVLQQMGARVQWSGDGVKVFGSGHLNGVDIAMNAMPDVAPTLAAIAPFASSPTRIRSVGFIRHHESDRIRALVTELRRLGAGVQEFDDGLLIEPAPLKPQAVETYDDHRIAMAFAVTGLKLPNVRIRNPGCVAKTYPDFFKDLARLRQ
ncbi:MAG: 3-phosphoshikimate 1-carboxyvinyltransferase [Candidatus Binataceae bacterium]